MSHTSVSSGLTQTEDLSQTAEVSSLKVPIKISFDENGTQLKIRKKSKADIDLSTDSISQLDVTSVVKLLKTHVDNPILTQKILKTIATKKDSTFVNALIIMAKDQDLQLDTSLILHDVFFNRDPYVFDILTKYTELPDEVFKKYYFAGLVYKHNDSLLKYIEYGQKHNIDIINDSQSTFIKCLENIILNAYDFLDVCKHEQSTFYEHEKYQSYENKFYDEFRTFMTATNNDQSLKYYVMTKLIDLICSDTNSELQTEYDICDAEDLEKFRGIFELFIKEAQLDFDKDSKIKKLLKHKLDLYEQTLTN